jgi:Methylmuconolactone methyl-isomerase
VPGLRRYVLTLIHDQPTRADVPSHDIDVDGIAELWYDDADAMRRAAATPEMQALRAHGALIIGRIKNYVTEERQVIPAVPAGN